MNLKQFVKSYWNYYLELEEQFISTKKYVDFDKSNSKTFSIEYLKLIQATCSEVDVVAKMIAEFYDINTQKGDYKTINKWGYALHNIFPNIEQQSVFFNDSRDIFPWKKWEYEKYNDTRGITRYRLVKGKNTPSWWQAYNKIKHERTSENVKGRTNYSLANLENLINSMSALFILENLFISQLTTTNEDKVEIGKSKLFKLN